MKSFEDFTFDELVEYEQGQILQLLLKGEFPWAVRQACDQTIRWHTAQVEKENKKRKK